MIEERALELAEALESGKYEQGAGALRRTTGEYCCLGVACELAGEEWEESKCSAGVASSYYVIKGTQNASGLSPRAAEYFGFQWEGSAPPGYTLMKKNDDGESFAAIANYIRQNWRDL